jgi:starch phosphorylase
MDLRNKMPEKLDDLPELATNLWWSWNLDARRMFKALDQPMWRGTQHRPKTMLFDMSDERFKARAEDPGFIRKYQQILMRYREEMQSKELWYDTEFPELRDKTIAYFSAEFGLHNSLPIYSGGLGILSGDHVKEASDCGLPLVGVGFMYPQGYFHQRLPSHGWQEAVYEQLDMEKAPVDLARDENNNPILISVRIGETDVYAQIWQVYVGRVTLYLMDTNVHENDPWNRELSARLYSGDSEMRIRQEIMLGIGGVRVLRAMGVSPDAWHMNEGHSAFLVLELVREKVAQGQSFAEAAAEVKACSVFTTHTPVPAGHDAFAFHMMEKYFREYWPDLGIDRDTFLNLGRHEEPWGVAFNMTVLALHMSGLANGVSQLHGEVSREMWQSVWPERPIDEVPIGAITNGVHVPTWIASEMRPLFAKYLGQDWIERHDDQELWEKLGDLPDDELWNVHCFLRAKLLNFLRERTRRRWTRRRMDPTEVITNGLFLDPDALTIGFARRFATYKRATLIFRDPERLKRILLDIDRPVQIVFAGKAHPADDPGKHLIQDIYNMAKAHDWGGRIAFIEDYDMHAGRYLKQGVDVWLNNPRRPREASGTSGMKAALNGVPNLSVLDGWWVEGYNGANGWAIGENREYDNYEEQDIADAESLYRLLEEEVVPLFYRRDHDGIPRGWVDVMRESIRSSAAKFSMRRMVKEYTTELYVPAMLNGAMVEEPA